MNCSEYIAKLDRHLDDELGEAETAEWRQHCETCADCAALLAKKAGLRQALSAIPYDAPESGFYDRLLEDTVTATHRSEMKFWASAGIGGIMAASVVAWMILVLPVDQSRDVEAAQLEGVTVSLNMEKTVRVSFDSVRDLQGATLTVQLPPGVEIAGYEGRSEISWSTDVTRGVNVLALPITIRAGNGGTVLAQVEHDGKLKAFKFDVRIS